MSNIEAVQYRIFVDSRETSISHLNTFCKNKKIEQEQLAGIEHVQSGNVLKKVEHAVSDHQSSEKNILLAMRLPSEEMLRKLNTLLKTNSQICHLFSYNTENDLSEFECISFPDPAFIKLNDFKKREAKVYLRTWTQYRLMRLIIERKELGQDELEKLIFADRVPNEDISSVQTYVDLDEPDMAGGTYASEQDSKNAIDEMRRIIKINAGADRHVLITGASGTGKETAAWATHELSKRRNNKFLTLNCGGFTDELLESELFGYTKGAHSTATTASEGLIKTADGGSLFLDEFPEMSPRVQAKMLRLCQTGEYRPLGANNNLKADVRIIAGAQPHRLNASAEDDIAGVREDLLYRLNKLELVVPSLQEMEEKSPGTIMKIAHILLERYTWDRINHKEMEPKKIDEHKFKLDELSKLVNGYDWAHNNVRELDTRIYQWLNYGDEYFTQTLSESQSKSRKDPRDAMKCFISCFDKKNLPRIGSDRSKTDGSPQHIMEFYIRAAGETYPELHNNKLLAEALSCSEPTISTYKKMSE